jgi:solute carrier family 35 protein F3/4
MQVVPYNAPFFTTWFCTNWTVLFFPLYFICCLISTKCKSPGNILRESVRNFRDKGFTAGKLKKKSSPETYTVFTGTNVL